MYASGRTLRCAAGRASMRAYMVIYGSFGRSLRVALCCWAPAGQYMMQAYIAACGSFQRDAAGQYVSLGG